MNKYDSELVTTILKDVGYKEAYSPDDSDIIIINTCAVRDHAEKRVLGRISVLKSWKNSRPGRKLGVIGCVAQVSSDKIAKNHPFVDFIAGPDSYRKLPGMILKSQHTSCIDTLLNSGETYSGIEPTRVGEVTGWLSIARGCNNFCSYCIVPYTRGRERSRSAKDIINELYSMADSGIKDVTLLGQNVNSYNDGETNFAGLLKKASRIPGILRIRFLTSHPKDISLELLEVMAENEKVCPHLHLPMQAGSDRVLEAMNRGYTIEHYMNTVEKAKAMIPDLALTTDIIVGFPGESDEDFIETYNAMRDIEFDDAFTYRFSPRAGTKAARMTNTVPEHIIHKRLNSIITLQREISLTKRKNLVGKKTVVIPEATSKLSNEEWIGKTAGNFTVVFPKNSTKIGEPVDIIITELRGATLRGIQVEEYKKAVV